MSKLVIFSVFDNKFSEFNIYAGTFLKTFIRKYRFRLWNIILDISKANIETKFMPDFDFFNGPSSALIEVRSHN